MVLGEGPSSQEKEPQDPLIGRCQRLLGDVFPPGASRFTYVPYPIPSARSGEFVQGVVEQVRTRSSRANEEFHIERNRRIMERHYGLDGEEPLQIFADVGRAVGTTGETARKVVGEVRERLRPSDYHLERDGLHSYIQIPPSSFARQILGADTNFFKDLPVHARRYLPLEQIDFGVYIPFDFEKLVNRRRTQRGLSPQYFETGYDFLTFDTTGVFMNQRLRDNIREGLEMMIENAEKRYKGDISKEQALQKQREEGTPKVNKLLEELPLSPEVLARLGHQVPEIFIKGPNGYPILEGVATMRQLFEMPRAELQELFEGRTTALYDLVAEIEEKIRGGNLDIEAGTVINLFSLQGERERRKKMKMQRKERGAEKVAAQRAKDTAQVTKDLEPAFKRGLRTVEEIQRYCLEEGIMILSRTPWSLVGEALIRQALHEKNEIE